MDNLVKDTKAKAFYSVAVMFMLILVAATGRFDGVVLFILIFACWVFGLGSVAFWHLYLKAKATQIAFDKLPHRLSRGERHELAEKVFTTKKGCSDSD